MSATIVSCFSDLCSELSGEDQLKACKIYGRTHEHLKMLHAFAHVVQTRQCQTVCIHGCSGSGKTALVEQLCESLCNMGQGFFCSGKFFQNSGFVQEPYSAIMAAFSDLCDLVSQSNAFDDARKEQIRRHLGSETHLLIKIISNLTPFLQVDTDVVDPMDGECQSHGAVAKFKMACKAFLHAMSSGSQSIILFLDDIQWMDEGSRQLIEMYLNDTELQNVMFILAYRDEEKHVVHSSLAKISDQCVVDVHVKDLDTAGVSNMVAGILDVPEALIPGLGEIIAQKTHGNPFHVAQFIDAIKRAKLLVWKPTTKTWKYKVADIQREMMVADSLADLLLRKIQKLPQCDQETLKTASLLGFRFQGHILDAVLLEHKNHDVPPVTNEKHSSNEVSLDLAIELGLVEKTRDGFQFSHDKVQTSFLLMLNTAEEEILHLIIGGAFLRDSSGESIFQAAIHLNEAVGLVKGDAQRLHLARINLEAAKHCIHRSAFDKAACLLRQGLSLLNEDEKRSTQFDMAFEMTETLAKMELILGNLVSCKKLTSETLRVATSVEMQINSLLIDVECCMAGNEMHASMRTAWRALGILGIRMPRKVSIVHILLKLFMVRRMLKGKTDDDILQLPSVQDQGVTAAASRILVNLTYYCFLQDAEFNALYSGLAAMELTLRHGLSPHSASALIAYANFEIFLGHIDRAYRFGQLGMKLLDTVRHRVTESMAISIFVSTLPHWKLPLNASRAPLSRAIESGFATGDPLYTSFAMANDFALAFFTGVNLHELERFMREGYMQLRDLSRKAMLLWVQPQIQHVINLQSEECSNWMSLTFLSGEIMNELCYDFGFTEEAERLMHQISRMGRMMHYNFVSVYIYFFSSMTCYERYRDTENGRHLKWARKWKGKLKGIQRQGSPNVTKLISLLEVEDISVLRWTKSESITNAFDLAILAMSNKSFIQMEALANERAAFALLHRGETVGAMRYFSRAISLYKYEWGAIAKADCLQDFINSSVMLMDVCKQLERDVAKDIIQVELKH